MKAFFVLVALAALIGASLLYQSGARDRTVAKCIAAIAESHTRFNAQDSIPARAMDRDGFCGCLYDRKGGGAVDTADQRACMDAHAREKSIALCESELVPRLRAETGMGLDCGCFYEEAVGRGLSYAETGVQNITSEQNRQNGMDIMRKCGRR